MENEIKEAKIKNLTAELAELEERHKRVKELVLDPFDRRIRDLKKERAELCCPFQVGEILVNKHGERAQVESIEPGADRYGRGNADYSLRGFFVKKDGTPWKASGRGRDHTRGCDFDLYGPWSKESGRRQCGVEHLREYPGCFEECGLDKCDGRSK